MKIINTAKQLVLLLVLLSTGACSSWLQVDPDDRIMEDKLFSDKEGYLTALNGVYTELNSNSVYGKNLSYGMIDVMAQYYDCTAENHAFSIYMDYDYDGSTYKSSFGTVWNKMYALIANTNTILKHCEKRPSFLSEEHYRLITGEAYALRAMLHMDLFRMFGPIPSNALGSETYMPYMKKADKKIQPLLTADSIYTCIVNDLLEASSYLETVDPVVTEHTKNPSTTSNDFNYRQYRLNYYAVQALMARVALWKGDNTNALRLAKKVVEDAGAGTNGVFPMVDAEYMRNYKDRLFSTEVLFGLYNKSRSTNVYKGAFSSEVSATSALRMKGTLTEGRVNAFYDDKNDHRYKMWAEDVQDNTPVIYFTKYKDETSSVNFAEYENFRYMLPLIRMSEMYLIIAECEADINEGVKALNTLRFSRNCVNIAATESDELQRIIKEEYMREFIGEGQLFFYFKRNELQNIPNGATVSGTQNIALSNYVFPLPDSEKKQRVNQ